MEYVKAFAPLLILILLFLSVGFYYTKKINRHAQELAPDNNRPQDSLTLIRGLEYVNYTRAYTVIIDGKKTTEISSGETCHIPISNASAMMRAMLVPVMRSVISQKEFEFALRLVQL